MSKANALVFNMKLIAYSIGLLIICSYAIQAHGIDSRHFSDAQDSLVIIHSRRGTGSGFIARMEDNYYLITNEHVLRGGEPFSALLIDGSRLAFDYVEIADDRDVARLRLSDTPLTYLSFSSDRSSVGERIFVYGNSDGGGVLTSISGRIQGIGPDLVEVDAEFVRGNSGSPIINTKGHVVAIATYVEKYADPDDWIKEGTRFSDIRRYGVRPNVTQWTRLSINEYFLRADALRAVSAFCIDLYHIMYTDHYFDKRVGLFRYSVNEQAEHYGQFIGMSELISDLVKSYNDTLRYAHSTIEHADRARQSRTRSEFDSHRRRTSVEFMQMQTRSGGSARVYRDMRRRVGPFIRNNDWKARRFLKEARYWYDVLHILLDSAE